MGLKTDLIFKKGTCIAGFTTGPVGSEPRAWYPGTPKIMRAKTKKHGFYITNAIKSYSFQALERAPWSHSMKLACIDFDSSGLWLSAWTEPQLNLALGTGCKITHYFIQSAIWLNLAMQMEYLVSQIRSWILRNNELVDCANFFASAQWMLISSCKNMDKIRLDLNYTW